MRTRRTTICCSAIGVVFISYWLDEKHPKNGVEAICNTIEHIREVTDSWDHIVLGTDFDGFTDLPDDLRDASQVWKVTVFSERAQRQIAEETRRQRPQITGTQ